MDLISRMIKQEINRFESVHPCIYASYDIFERIKNIDLSNKLKDCLVSVEEAFVNSQEWTLSRAVLQLKIALLGSHCSRKSELVHYYLTGIYTQDDNTEGGRFKKLITVGSQPYLLLLRDEAAAPDLQLVNWVDALVFVVSSTSQQSVRTAYEYYNTVCSLCYPGIRLPPLMLVATQDDAAIGQSIPEVEANINYLCSLMKNCPLYQSCAVYGLNVDNVFNGIAVHVLTSRQQPLACGVSSQQSVPTPMQESRYTPSAPHNPSTVALSTSFSLNDEVPNRLLDPMAMEMHSSQNTASGYPSRPANLKPQFFQRFSVNLDHHHQALILGDDSLTAQIGGSQLTRQLTLSPVTSLDCMNTEDEVSRHAKSMNFRSAWGPSIRPSSTVALTHHLSGLTLFDKRAAPCETGGGPSQHVTSDASIKEDRLCGTPNVHSWTGDGSALLPLADQHQQQLQRTVAPTAAIQTTDSTPAIEVNQQKMSMLASNTAWESVGTNRRDRPRPQSTGSLAAGFRNNSNNMTSVYDLTGAGRLFPLRQGYLYQKFVESCAGASKRRKKYVVLTEDARLICHPSKQDYTSGLNGRSADLTLAAVRILESPGEHHSCETGSCDEERGCIDVSPHMVIPCTADMTNPNVKTLPDEDTPGDHLATLPSTPDGSQTGCGLKKALKRQYKRAKAAVTETTHTADRENPEFIIHTTDGTQWHFEAPNISVRDDWLQVIDNLIHRRSRILASRSQQPQPLVMTTIATTSVTSADLTISSIAISQQPCPPSGYSQHFPYDSVMSPHAVLSSQQVAGLPATVCQVRNSVATHDDDQNRRVPKEQVLARLTELPGNQWCADCGAPDPDYALLSLAVLVCADCSEVHHSLNMSCQSQSHGGLLSQLSDPRGWMREHVTVMTVFGNTLANSVWEASAPSQYGQFQKPDTNAVLEERRVWIHNKYVSRIFLPPSPVSTAIEFGQQRALLTDAVVRRDFRCLLLSLVQCRPSNGDLSLPHATTPSNIPSPLHTAAALGDTASLLMLLWWNGASLSDTDRFGLTAWSYAQAAGHATCAHILLTHGCRPVPAQAIPVSYDQLQWLPPSSFHSHGISRSRTNVQGGRDLDQTLVGQLVQANLKDAPAALDTDTSSSYSCSESSDTPLSPIALSPS